MSRLPPPLTSPPPEATAPAGSALQRQHRRHWRIFAAMALVVASLTAYEAAESHRLITVNEQGRLQSLARAIDINLQQQVAAIDHVLEDLAGEVALGAADAGRRNERLRILTQAMPGVRSLLIADRSGHVSHASRADLVGRDIADSEFFRVPRATPDIGRLYVTAPIETRQQQDWVLPLVRIVPDARAGFNGIVEATIDPHVIDALLASVLYAPDVEAAIVHGNGLLFKRLPRGSADAGVNLAAAGSLFARHRDSGLPATVLTGRAYGTGEARLAAQRTFAPSGLPLSNPLQIAVSRGIDAIYAPWYEKMIAEAAVIGLLLLASAAALRYYQHRQNDTEARFARLIDHAPCGIMLIDSDGRIDRINRAFTALTGYGAQDVPDVPAWRRLAYPDADYRAHVAGKLQALRSAQVGGALRRDTMDAATNIFTVRAADDRELQIKFVETGIGTRRMVILEDVTERERLAAELEAREALLSKIFDTASVAIFLVDRQGVITHANQRMAEMFGSTLEALEGSEYVARVHPDERDVGRQKMRALLASDIPTVDLERLYWREDGSQFWGHLTGRRFQDANGREIGLIGVISDIDVRKKAAQRHAAMVESAMDGFLIVGRDGRIKECNQVLADLTGYRRDELLQLALGDLDAAESAQAATDRLASVVQHGRDRFEARWRCRNDAIVEVEITASYLDLGAEICAFVRDITQARAHQRALDRIAHYDALTGVPNRNLLSDRMAQAAAQTRRTGTMLAVCYLDLDGFKPINDRYGHAAGDRVLIEVARRLQDCMRGGDTVARIGGDEFVLLLLGLQRADEAAAMQRILDAVAAPLTMADGGAVSVSASLGVAIYPHDDADVDILLRHADQAMYRAKRAGKNCYRLYDAALEGDEPVVRTPTC